ncbi:hypothetical protein AX16_001263 [Volvariella volvacea WC 439]|nr:hypothetical protein AX16_001263 [Volvariella volvacea WC 439]
MAIANSRHYVPSSDSSTSSPCGSISSHTDLTINKVTTYDSRVVSNMDSCLPSGTSNAPMSAASFPAQVGSSAIWGNAFAPVDKTNFGLGQRLCSTCAEPTMVSPTSWDGETGDGVLWSVIPYASFFSGNGDDVPTSEAYLKSDVIKVSGDISRFKALVAANDEGAKESYEEYCRLAQQIASIREKWNTACHRIFQDIYTAIDKEQDDQLPELDSQLKKRYIKLGFTGEDYDEGRYSFELRDFELVRHRRISTKVWKRVRRQTEHHMVDAMKDRLERERQILLQSRRNVVNDVYTKYRENCTPVTWAYHPPGYTIQTYEPFLSLIEDPSDRSITEEDCTPGVAVLPELVAKWTLEKIVQLASLLPGPEPAAGEPSYISPSSPLVFHALQKLDLATSVFHCLGSENSTNLGGRCLIGWEGAGAHLRCGALKAHYDNRLHFNQRGYDAAVALVELSGRDPKVTSAREMDADGLRFVCANCSPTSWPGRKVLAWRDAILHYLDSPLEPNGHSQETPPAFTLLTPVAAIDVKRLEQWDPLSPPPRDISWCCNLCSAHWDESATKAGAVSHVQTAHNIRTPVENVHYIFFASSMRTKPRPVMLKDAVDATYKCLRCHNNPKLWCRGPLMAHLRDKHETLGPNENEDWMKVERFLRTTPQRQSQPAQTSPDDSSDSVATSP